MRVRKQDSLPLLQLLPNIVTIIGLCAGLTAIRFILLGRFDLAAMLIVFAAVIDGIDGLLARKLGVASSFGAELDSLSDFLNFGVATGLLVFQFAMADAPGTNWVFALVYIICACLRLARFNVHRDAPPPLGKPHFVGVPAPGGSVLAMLPLFLTNLGLMNAAAAPLLSGLYLALIGLLMVSTVPTPSSKSLRIPREKSGFVLIGAATVMGLLVSRFWLLMAIVGLLYAGVIVWAIIRHLRSKTF